MGRKLAPLAGVGAVVLIVAAVLVGGEPPDTDDSAREIVEFYREEDSSQVLGAVLLAWGTLLFLVFLSVLWTGLRSARSDRLASTTLSLAGGIIFAVGMAIFAGIGFVVGDTQDDLPPEAIQALHVLNVDFFFPAALGGAAFYFGTGAAIVQTGALPKWLGWIGIVLGVLALTPAGFVAFLALGVWVLLLSVFLALRERPATPAPAEPS